MAEHAELVRLLHDAGWNRYGWPESAGGLGGDERHRAVLYELLSRARAAHPRAQLPLETLGPPALRFAPEAGRRTPARVTSVRSGVVERGGS
jgi:hypothetical protein